MSEALIRLAAPEDAAPILELLKCGLAQMRADGNCHQWTENTHTIDSVRQHIRRGDTYVVEEQGRRFATFVLLQTPDPTYSFIEGAWLRDAPYVTFHSLASDGRRHGVAHFLFDWARETFRCDLRLDTHHDNHRMQHLARSYGFRECGVIYLADGAPRKAYQYLNPYEGGAK